MKQIRNFGWLSAEDLVRLVLSFIVMVLVARHLGPADYGALSYIFGVVGLLAPLTALGLDAITVRSLVAQPDHTDPILGTAFIIRIAGATIATVAAIGFVALFGGPQGVTLKLAVVAALVLPFQSTETFNGYFKATERMAWMATSRTAVRCAMAIATIWLVAIGGGMFGFVALRVIEAFLLAAAAVIAFVIASKTVPSLKLDVGLLRSMLFEGTPLFLSALAVVIYMRVDQIMLGQLASASEVGQYSVAVRICESAFFIPMALQAAFFPGLARAAREHPESWLDELRHYYDVTGLAMVGLAIAIATTAPIILTKLLGPAYLSSVPMVWVLAVGIPFVGLGVARSAFLTIQGWLWTAPLTTALGAVVNVALNFALIPAWGGVGAACATVIAYWLAAHGSCLLFPWLRPTGRDLTLALNPLGAVRRIYTRRLASQANVQQHG